jgi:pimeloyl-ACP methyl ester carboxylesterase
MKSLTCLLLSLPIIGCGGGKGSPATDMTVPPDMSIALGPAPTLMVQNSPSSSAMPCSDALADLYTLPTLAPYTSANRGDIFRCAVTESVSAEAVNTLVKGYQYTGSTLPSGFWSWRIAYRTERATPPGVTTPVEGDTPAVVLVPEKPLPGAPLVVFAHGSVGIAPKCAPSYTDLSMLPDAANQHDYPVNLYALAGYGYTVIMPDYPGFAYGQPPGYFSAADEAHAVLDATRAVSKLLPTQFDKVVIVGHSQGGHSAFASQIEAGTYGLQGELVGVATYAPFWPTMALWAAIATPLAGANTTDDVAEILFSMEYFYSAGELLDGPGHGTDNFANPAAAKQVLVGGDCYDSVGLAALGTNSPDIYTSDFVNDVGGNCALGGGDCSSPASTLWLSRWKADRPPIDPAGAPILVWLGALDTFLAPNLAQCVEDTVTANGANSLMTYCYDLTATHNSLVRADSDYVNEWISFKAGIGADPGSCPVFDSGSLCRQPPINY